MTSLSENTVVTTSGGLVELGYSQITSSVFPATTTFPASTEVIAPLTVVCDGSPIIVEFWCCYAKPANTADQSLTISLFVDGAENQRYWGYLQTPASANSYKPVHLMCRLTPSAGVHTFGVKALVSAGTGVIGAGAGGGSVESPAFLRVSKIIQASQFIVPLASAPLVTSLPSTGNIDGQEVRYLVDDTNGTIWNLRWRASANRWEPISGFESDRNKIINGYMQIDQRNSGNALTGQSGVSWFCDRWRLATVTPGTLNIQRVSNDGPSSVGPYSIKATVNATDTSIAATDYYDIVYRIEGQDMADLQWGTTNAKTITLSFWVKSNLTGTYSVGFRNNAATRAYVAAYTINAANTWERKILTVPGDTTGTWLTNTDTGVTLDWTLAVGSTYQTTPNVWTGSNVFATNTGHANLMATGGNTFQLAGVQFEQGPTATPFQPAQYEDELRKSQRYYMKWISGSNAGRLGMGLAYNTTSAGIILKYRTEPRIVLGSVSWKGSGLGLSNATAGFYLSSLTRYDVTCSYEHLGINANTTGITSNATYFLEGSSDSNAWVAVDMEH